MDKKTKVKKTIPDTICRVHRSGGYAVLSNCFVRSTNIGCDSIGLLGKINDLLPAWNFTIAGLVAICEDGETAIKSQLAELEQWGYVKKTLLMSNESPTGRISYLYDFYEYSELDDSIPKYDIEMEIFTADNNTKQKNQLLCDKSSIIPAAAKPTFNIPSVEKSAERVTDGYNTEEVEYFTEVVRDNLDYWHLGDWLCQDGRDGYAEADEIVGFIVDEICSPLPYTTLRGQAWIPCS